MSADTPRWGAATATGPHRRRNEDSYLAGPTVFAVADGMGGHPGGDVASTIATSVLRSHFDELSGATAEDLCSAVARAHDEIVARGRSDPSTTGMGTTLTGVAATAVDGVDGVGQWMVFNVGDSRVYRLEADILTQVTVDHSEVEELVKAGVLDREQARHDLRRNIITRSLGTGARPTPDLWTFPPTPAAQFLICSDGLTGELSDAEILELMRAAATPQDVARSLVDAALSAGGHDNVTVVVVET